MDSDISAQKFMESTLQCVEPRLRLPIIWDTKTSILDKVAKPGAPIIFTLRDDPAQEPAYPAKVAELTASGARTEVWSSAGLHSMPYGADEVTHRIHVYRKT